MSLNSWISFHHNDSQGFDEAVGNLERVGQAIQDKVGSGIREELDSLTAQAKAKLLGEPVHGLKQTGLRARIAAATSVVPIEDGYQIQVTSDDPNTSVIPWGLDLESKGWKHPVFGHKPFVSQHGTVPWWSETMAQAQPHLEEKLPEKIDEAVKEVFGE